MKTKRIITAEDSKKFFASSVNTMDDAFGILNLNKDTKELSCDFNAVLLLRFDGVFADTNYSYKDEKFDKPFIDVLHRCFHEPITEKTEYTYVRVCRDGVFNFSFKLENISPKEVKITIICFEKLLETESLLGMFSHVIGSGVNMFTGTTLWIDYDHYHDHFYQTESGPRLLGLEVSPNRLYSTREFGQVRQNARILSPFYDESIEEESLRYIDLMDNKTNYHGSRTPAATIHDEILWVESYGKCYLRYPDGRPRFFVALEIYLSEVYENLTQLTLLNNLIDSGLVGSDVGVWYHQRHHKEGRYYFTNSFQNLMTGKRQYKNSLFTELFDEQIAIAEEKGEGHEQYLHEFRRVHNSIYTELLDKYHLVIPNYKNKDTLQWIDVRGTVVERDEEGNVLLFVGINVDVTDSYNRQRELERLRIQNDRLTLAERLAVKARDLMVWYTDPDELFSNNYIFGNEIFSKKLGLNRSKDGMIFFDDLVQSLDLSDHESKKMNVNLLRNVRAIINGKQDVLKKVVGKHINPKTGESIYLEHSIEATQSQYNPESRIYGGICIDVTDNILTQQRIEYLANFDILTGIHNRNSFETFIKNKLPDTYSVILCDLDGLKLTNDAFGHLEGDKTIQTVANLLKEVFHQNLFLGRIGGDEFVVIISSTDYDFIQEKSDEFDRKLAEYNATHDIEINVSKGGIDVNNNDTSFDKAFVHAENVMYRRKLNSRSSRKSKVLESIMETLNAKTEETKEHSDRISKYAVRTMEGLGMTRENEIDDVKLLSRIHDIGKITIPDEVLFKTSRLTPEEYEVIKKHCEAGYKITRNITDSDEVCNGVLFHHEKWDGTGYPQGLKGEEIPIFARIICVADSFDAMTSDRVYQKRKTEDEAIAEIIRCSGTQFDPTVVKAFLKSCFNIELDEEK